MSSKEKDSKVKNCLRNIKMFKGLSEEELQGIESNLRIRWKSYVKGNVILDSKDDSKEVYLICEGKVRILKYSISGRNIVFSDLSQGDIFGELAAIDGSERSATVQAMTTVHLGMVSDQDFQGLLVSYPSVALKLLCKLSDIVRTSVDRIMDLSTMDAQQKVASELLRMGQHNESNNQAVIYPAIRHSYLASKVGVSRETVSRIVSKMQKEKILVRKESVHVIQDVNALKEILMETGSDE